MRFTATEPIRPGSSDFAVRVQWPSGLVAGQPASWQVAMDRQDQIEPIANLGVLALTIFVLVVGLLGLYLLWYRKGRDAPVKLPAEWIPEPPSDLPAGMVGTLIDERADTKDVMATLVDLARRGVLAIQEESKPGLFGIGKSQEFTYHLENAALPMRPYEKLLVDKLFDGEQSKQLSDLREKFYVTMGQVQKGLYQAVVDDGYFPGSPERVRTTYAGLGVAALILACVVGCFATIFLVQWSGLAICLPIAFAIPAIGLIVLARYMPRKSANGAEEAAKWLAFKRYMENIEQLHQGRGGPGDLRPLPALRHRLRAGAELDRQVRARRYAAAALVQHRPVHGTAAARLGLVGRRTDDGTVRAVPRRCLRAAGQGRRA